MKFFEECVNSFDTLSDDIKNICDAAWRSVSLEVQEKKLTTSGINNPEERSRILNDLQQRPAFLSHVAARIKSVSQKSMTFVEVGTAQGLQSLVFARSFPDSRVYTCDIQDNRDHSVKETTNIKFTLGDSLALNGTIRNDDRKVDFCWIDGAHDNYSVIDDYLSLVELSHPETVWAFDDYDTRFGCFRDINVLLRHFEDHVVLDMGKTASGNPNRIVLMRRPR